MSYEPRDYLRHILVEADYLIGQTERTFSFLGKYSKAAGAGVRPD